MSFVLQEHEASATGQTLPGHEAFFRNCYDAILIVDPVTDEIVDANRAASRLLDYPPEALRELPASALHPHEVPALTVFTQAVMERGFGWTDELSCRNRQGNNIPVECSATYLEHGGRRLLSFTLRDKEKLRQRRKTADAHAHLRQGISEWKRIEDIFQEIELENKLILNAAGEGIYGINSAGNTTFMNPAAERMLGWTAEDIVGKNVHNVIHHSHADGSHYMAEECPIYAAFKDGAVHRVDDEVFWCRDGTPLPVEYTSTPIRDNGRLVGAVVIFRDISERKIAESNLHAALEEVGDLKHKLEMENAYLQEEIRSEHNCHEIVGKSIAIQQVIRQIELVAPTDANVLITGESGTGKELIAHAIHNSSLRRQRPLIRVNCAAIPHNLFESEFFGHVKGSFTGAVSDRVGRFELANGGTLFLDEVGEIPLELQSKLLRVLQEGQFERVGENKTREVNVRIIAATNCDLKSEVSKKTFREDLFFRLNVFPIELAPLRDRIEDIPLLATHLLKRLRHKLNKADVRLTQADIGRLQEYSWPGNIRELGNVIERAIIVSRNGKLVLDLPNRSGKVKQDNGGQKTLNKTDGNRVITEEEWRRNEHDNIVSALRSTNGKVFGPGGAAELLEMKPTTLSSKLKRLGIDKDSFSSD